MPRKAINSQDAKPTAPAPGGAVREPIKNMIAPGSEESFERSLPESTASTDAPVSPDGTKRKRRTKEEMAAARGEGTPAVDPNMDDPRYKKIVAEMSGMGGKEIVSLGFSMSGAPLKIEEEQKIDDVFYVIGRKGGFNPASSWISLSIYFVVLVGRMILARTDIGANLKALFSKKPPTPAPLKKEETEELLPLMKEGQA